MRYSGTCHSHVVSTQFTLRTRRQIPGRVRTTRGGHGWTKILKHTEHRGLSTPCRDHYTSKL